MTSLETLLVTHADTLRPLLGSLWPVRPQKVEYFGPLTKYTVGPMPDGRWAMFHHIREADTGPPHCHPCQMDILLLKGSYAERIYRNGGAEDVLRVAGDFHTIEPERIHQLFALPEGEAWSLCFAGPVVRQWRHYPELV
ncbi:hypothetical protein LJY25_14875 [Hymenobacter sp. BT175]|uniref:hypothetical protein n=1 Tax=Hymenobacter translucens TaxID=2886507 RepID=UPI001D0E8991|nr:hypothetical protein [Hymenobacter translucens]MCC2547737.1 hypothetical protein [Hymenobacter translucens]